MNPRLHAFLDRFGATGSLICAVHCALLPLVLAAIPSLGLSEWLGDGFELSFVVFATSVGVFSLVYGYRRPRRIRALRVLLAGDRRSTRLNSSPSSASRMPSSA